MKVFVIIEKGFSYDDEYYSEHEGDAGKPIKAFRQKANADAECAKLNVERKKTSPLEGYDGEFDEYHVVREVEVSDSDVVGYAEAQDAPPEVQDAKAREVWAGGAGCSHWAAC